MLYVSLDNLGRVWYRGRACGQWPNRTALDNVRHLLRKGQEPGICDWHTCQRKAQEDVEEISQKIKAGQLQLVKTSTDPAVVEAQRMAKEVISKRMAKGVCIACGRAKKPS